MPGPVPNFKNVATALEVLTTEAKAYVEYPTDSVTIIESIRNLSRDINKRFSEMDARFTALEQHMNRRFSEIDAKFDGLSTRFTALEQQQLESSNTFARMVNRLARPSDILAPLRSRNNTEIPGFPKTASDISDLTGPALDALLAHLDVAVNAGTLVGEKRNSLKRAIGVQV